MDLLYLLDAWKWFGRHTGYSLVVEGMGSRGDVVPARRSAGGNLLNAIGARLHAWSHQGAWCCAGRDRESEEIFLARWEQRPEAVGHVLFYERHHPLFQRWRRAPANLITTIHHPAGQMGEWHAAVREDLGRISSAIVLYQRDLDFFEKRVGRGRVRFIRHGVDTEFFRPAPEPPEDTRRLLFVGVNGRNLAMLRRVVLRLAGAHPGLRFDLLVPSLRAKPRERLRLAGLWRHPQVTWHAGLSDEGLRALYQASYLLLLPLTHAAACNAVVEALACGRPVVTTDVGGVRDYGGGTVCPVVPNDDDNGMVELVERYLAEPHWHRQVAAGCRRFAEEALCWSRIREAHLKAYVELGSGC